MQLPHDAEADAIAFGLLLAVTTGAAVIVATLINAARKRRNRDARSQELFNLKTGLHPADDIYGGDSWPEFGQFQQRNPEAMERILGDALKHRGKESN